MTDMTGSVVGRLTVIRRADTNYREAMWLCQCECGKTTTVAGSNLRKGHTRSCGCLRDETKSRLKHGMRGSSEYAIWNGIKGRCENPNNPAYSRYGGRGITMHEPWSASFDNFYADVGPRPSKDHSIDRVDNARGYEPGNVRWATRSEQVRNSSIFNGGLHDASTKAEMAEDIIRLERDKAEAQADALKLRADNRALLDEIERYRDALTKISAIRDSIVGMQGFNFSEHAYPLVAALDAAGFKGAGYEIARKNLGTLIEQLAIAERELERWRHGRTIEGDFVCPSDLERDSLRSQLAAMTAARDEALMLQRDAQIQAEDRGQSYKRLRAALDALRHGVDGYDQSFAHAEWIAAGSPSEFSTWFDEHERIGGK